MCSPMVNYHFIEGFVIATACVTGVEWPGDLVDVAVHKVV